MNNNLLIDFIEIHREQLKELKIILLLNYRKENILTRFLMEKIDNSDKILYNIFIAINGNDDEKIEINNLIMSLNELEQAYNLMIRIENKELKYQSKKCATYARILDELMVNNLPDIDDYYYELATYNKDLLDGINELIK